MPSPEPPINVAVLQSSYGASDSVFKDWDTYDCTPRHYFDALPVGHPAHGRYRFTNVWLDKSTSVIRTLELLNGVSASGAEAPGPAGPGACPLAPGDQPTAPNTATSPSSSASAQTSAATASVTGPFDFYVNLTDGAWDEDRAGVEVCEALQRFRAPYTGADPRFFSMTKEAQKLRLNEAGLVTAPYVFCYTEADLQAADRGLDYPLILKHYNSGGSIGMTVDSRVETRDQLLAEGRRFLREFGGVLVEEFIAGREFTVLVSEGGCSGLGCQGADGDPAVFCGAVACPGEAASRCQCDQDTRSGCTPGTSASAAAMLDEPAACRCGRDRDPLPHAYQPVECSFAPDVTFKYFDIKWIAYEGMEWTPVVEEPLAGRLREQAVRAFRALGGTGYGRVDVRLCQRTGDLVFLEINQNCGLFYERALWGSADYILHFDSPEHGVARFFERIRRAAFRRARRSIATFHVRTCPAPVGGPVTRRKPVGCFASVALRPGDCVAYNEACPMVVSSPGGSGLLQADASPPLLIPEPVLSGDRAIALRGAPTPGAQVTFSFWPGVNGPAPVGAGPQENHQANPQVFRSPAGAGAPANARFGQPAKHDGTLRDPFSVFALRDILPGEEIVLDYDSFLGLSPGGNQC
ncbi:hypothetical protein H696_02857 [Fonticula alba]|uniref:ATP-grasp domain-containing protein n=1 Tax=Fonticula alba TaxID=691883 RepID=A0A058Z9D9_FONAL|nr:hypothetical protein H696_02857 [Fonticula alba]KCV70508.1 hypothetical protein H696_02857 [Fonticula alba]|eukprot:XP_009495024.1 hypothetical protein H696_02857 [Fonticula alba]